MENFQVVNTKTKILCAHQVLDVIRDRSLFIPRVGAEEKLF